MCGKHVISDINTLVYSSSIICTRIISADRYLDLSQTTVDASGKGVKTIVVFHMMTGQN